MGAGCRGHLLDQLFVAAGEDDLVARRTRSADDRGADTLAAARDQKTSGPHLVTSLSIEKPDLTGARATALLTGGRG